MTIKLNKDTLVEVCERAIKFTDESNPLPICNNFLISSDGDSLSVRATDVKGDFESVMHTGSGEVYAFCVPAILFYSTIKDFRDTIVSISIDKDCINIKSGKSKYKIATVDISEFPTKRVFTTSGEMSIKATSMKEIIKNCLHFIADGTDMKKLQFTGVYMAVHPNKKNIVFISTDSNFFCMAMSEPLSMSNFPSSLISEDTCKKLIFLIRDESSIDVYSTGKSITFVITNGNTKHIFQDSLLEYPFPEKPALKFFDTISPKKVSINTVELIETTKRVMRYCNPEVKIIAFSKNEAGTSLYAENINFGNSGEEMITFISDDTNHSIRIGFNGDYFSKIVGQINEENTEMAYSEPNKMVFITPIYTSSKDIEYKYIVMPCILNN